MSADTDRPSAARLAVTGLDVEITGLVGTYADPRHIIAYRDGEVHRQFNVCFTARITGADWPSRTSPRNSDSSLPMT